LIILGIETSCDETAASILSDGKILSNIVHSQLIHSEFGGVVPSLASKNHEELINKVVSLSLKKADVSLDEIDAIAVTQGPGLVGSLIIGLNYAKGLSIGLDIPIIGINHLEGHLHSGILNYNISYPYLCLLVSGGHTQIWHVSESNKYLILSTTVDDAAGEAFDKGAKILGLGYPGGPEIEKIAINGNCNAYDFTIAKVKSNPLNFSFSGLKTSLLYLVKNINSTELSLKLPDIAASYQECIIDTLLDKVKILHKRYNVNDILVVGGVSCNKRFRDKSNLLSKKLNSNIIFPEIEYCTDNAAMIAIAGWKKYQNNNISSIDILPYSSFEYH
tara:strand:+ start:11 stop:1006 length:996 start_codon:yes stop_codon:yes gene_type:complete